MRRLLPLAALAVLAGCHKPQAPVDNSNALINESAPATEQASQSVTLTAPDVPPCFASDTGGSSLVSFTLVSRTGAVGGAGGGPPGGATGLR